MVFARPDGVNSSAASRRRNPSASFGQQRHLLQSATPAADNHSGEVVKATEDGGMSISFMPKTTSRDDRDPNDTARKLKQKKKAGIEYLGAGLERGVERAEVAEADRKGRTHRRKNVRSGSKNAFRGL